MTNPRVEYSGQPFGRPNPAPLTKAWRIKQNFLSARLLKPYAASVTLLGQDSVGVTAMSRGLSVYCGYEAGTLGYANGGYTTMPQVYSVFPGKLYVSVGRDAIDIEPGLASASDGPGFVRGAKPPHTSKPMVYCSAGDLGAVIGALNGAGVSRSSYYLWSAHWIGEHICGPSSCGYPACDGTQYDSNNSFDSDVWYSYCFGTPVPPPPTWPLAEGSTDTALVKNVQTFLNNRRAAFGNKYPALTVDGVFGPATKAAVIVAQEGYGERGAPAGVVTQWLYAQLEYTQPPTTPPVTPPPTDSAWRFGPVRNLKVDPTTATITWDSPNVYNPAPTDGSKPGIGYFTIEGNKGTSLGKQGPGYPAYVKHGQPQTFTFKGLENGATYTVGVRAAAAGSPSHSPAFTTVTFSFGTSVTPPVSAYPSFSQAVASSFATINGEIIYGFLRQHGYNAMQAAGAIASMWGEGEWSPEVSGTGGFGLIGWTGNTIGLPSGYTWPTGNVAYDMQIQCEGILGFVAGAGDQGTVDQMATAATINESAQLWGQGVERYGINDVHPEGVAAAAAIALSLDGVTLPQ